MGVSKDQFEEEVLSGERTDYVEDELLEFLADAGSFEVKQSTEVMNLGEKQPIVNITTPGSMENLSDTTLIENVKDKLSSGGTDIQKYQLRVNNSAPLHVVVVRQNYGYRAFVDN